MDILFLNPDTILTENTLDDVIKHADENPEAGGVGTMMLYTTTVILAHNHPSGIAVPSGEDIQTTQRVAAALNTVDIILADHIVVADEDFTSMIQSGYRFCEDMY